MCRPNGAPEPAGTGGTAGSGAAFTALLEDSAEDLYESAPCGYLSTLMDGTIAKINTTLLDWLGLEREAVVGRKRFTDLLTIGGKLYHETHFAPLLRMQGELRGIALDLKRQGGGRLPVLVSAVVKYGARGEPLLIRVTAFDASDRRSYETELLHRRKEAERARAEADEARRQAEADRARLADALAVLQRSLVPDSLPAVPGLETAVHYHTAAPEQLGGDFYDLFPVAGDRWAFFLGDVCGKGPEAASLTSLTRYTLRAAAHHDPEPAAALATLNAVLHERYTAGGDPRYCTCLFGIIQPGGGTGLRSCASPPAVTRRRSPCAPTAAPSSCPPPAACSSASCPTHRSAPWRPSWPPATRSCCTPTVSPRPAPAPAATTCTARTPCGCSPPASLPPPRVR